MFSLRNFILQGLVSAIGKMADYQIILNAAGWLDKNVLLEEDLQSIHQQIEEYHAQEALNQEQNAINEMVIRLIDGEETWDNIPEANKEAVKAILQEKISEGSLSDEDYLKIVVNN